MSKISGKVCIVTGGGNGIGKSLCEALATAGARSVFVVDINAKAAKEVADHLSSLATNPNFRGVSDVADVGSEVDIKRIIHSAWEIFGTIDVFFSNAGIFTVGGVSDKEVSNEAWEKIWRVNVLSHIFAARSLIPIWKEHNQRGTFVITASAAGLLMQPGCLPYHVTKHAAVSVADWIAVTHRQDGVSVHCLCPQAVQTDMLTTSAVGVAGQEKAFAKLAGRDGILEPDDVARITIQDIEDGKFMILPHKQVHKYFVNKSNDYDRWIATMVKAKEHFDKLLPPPTSRSKL